MVIQGMAWTSRESKFDLQQGQEFFFLGHSIRAVCGTHPSCRSLRTGLLGVVVQRLLCEACWSVPCMVEVQYAVSCASTPFGPVLA